jgi:hypothetical protein
LSIVMSARSADITMDKVESYGVNGKGGNHK